MPFYWVTGATAASPTAAFDAIELVEPGTGLLRIWRVRLWQTTDIQDAAEEILRTEWVRGNATSGSGGQTTVITPLNSFDPAATFTAELLNTTVASTGSPVSLAVGGWNIRIPQDELYPPEQVITLRNGERACYRVSAPNDAITCNAACLVEQL
jgi:hypothetical protein